jgi:hypothetical protein
LTYHRHPEEPRSGVSKGDGQTVAAHPSRLAALAPQDDGSKGALVHTSRALLRYFPKRFPDRQHRVPDQAGILDPGLTVFDRFPIDGVADHFGERRNGWIFGDEGVIPAIFLRPDQHQFEPALPDDLTAEPFEHRAAFVAIGGIGFRAGGLAAVGLGGLVAQPDQIEHMDRSRPIVGLELREDFLGRIDVAHAGSSFKMPTVCTTRRRTS